LVTVDWFSALLPKPTNVSYEALSTIGEKISLPPAILAGSPSLRFLQIGSFDIPSLIRVSIATCRWRG
jgi:hypothetical protein